jgi:hypothetical protein
MGVRARGDLCSRPWKRVERSPEFHSGFDQNRPPSALAWTASLHALCLAAATEGEALRAPTSPALSPWRGWNGGLMMRHI